MTVTIARPRPLPEPARPYAFPRFERHTLANGLGLVIAPVSKLPIVTLLAIIDAGAVTDAAGKEGLAQLTAHALGEGAAGLDGAALIEHAEQLGTAINTSADWDAAFVELTVLASRLGDAMALLGDVLTAPMLPAHEVERLRSERLAELLQRRAEPRELADEMLDRAVYAGGARYGRPAGGTETSVAELTPDDVTACYRTLYQPGAVTLVVVGDVRTAQVQRLVEARFGSWRGAARADIATPDGPAAPGRRVHVVTKSGSPQSELRLGHRGIPRAHPDYFATVIMNAVLGGLFSSRLNLNLREAHGYTYGAHSAYDWRRWAGPFLVDVAVQRDVTAAAVRETLGEIERIREAPVNESELSLATSYLDGVFPIRYETTAAIATALANLVIYHLAPDFYDTYRTRVREVTTDQVLGAARAHLDPGRLQLVAVGDPESVRQPLEVLDFGPLTVYDDRGEPIS
jgi:zinc protease